MDRWFRKKVSLDKNHQLWTLKCIEKIGVGKNDGVAEPEARAAAWFSFLEPEPYKNV
jgi:hypothetical protein